MNNENKVCIKCDVKLLGNDCLACKKMHGDEIYAIDFYERNTNPAASPESARYGIAIDIGTTTVAFELIEINNGTRIAAYSCANSQRALGSDVLSRISFATAGNAERLNTYIIEDIKKGVTALLLQSGIEKSDISLVAITGNTTMLHLLQNLPCDTLGVFPFTPVSIETVRKNFLDYDVIILPGASAFIGADVIAGIFFCEISETFLFIDLGTNGEIVLHSHNNYFAASAAAGPAFEGGNISMGTASIPGAIVKANFLPENGVFDYETIGNLPPTGISGTGVIDICAELIRRKLADKTGLLKSGDHVIIANHQCPIIFTQKDIREVQLAKSAVRAGIEILISEAGLSYDKIQKVFLAGGFGYKMNPESAAAIGLIPTELKNKIIPIGNAALGGCAKFLQNDCNTKIEKLARSVKEINLSTHPMLNELFIKYINME